jgi:hypothetical protein
MGISKKGMTSKRSYILNPMRIIVGSRLNRARDKADCQFGFSLGTHLVDLSRPRMLAKDILPSLTKDKQDWTYLLRPYLSDVPDVGY